MHEGSAFESRTDSKILGLVQLFKNLSPSRERDQIFKEIVKLSAPFINSKVRKFAAFDSLTVRQAAIKGLEAASVTYLPERGSFYTWANWSFKGFLRDESRMIRRNEIPIEENMLTSLIDWFTGVEQRELDSIQRFNLYLQESQSNPYCEMLSVLDETAWKLIVLKFWHRSSREEISEATQIPVPNLYYQRQRALRKLCDRFKLREKYFLFCS